jgi:FlaA1/EpsC-like NDP-sugar epimerase
MHETLSLLGRTGELLSKDVDERESELREAVEGGRFLVIGGAGSIGQAVTKELFARGPRALHIVDLSENNMTELVRDIRSSLGYMDGDFRTFAVDCGSREFRALHRAEGPYDYVLNLSALKHVRSEKDPYTLMRMVEVNVLNTLTTLELAEDAGSRKYFAVSTDKAANPVNMMGASKRIMEMFLVGHSDRICISTARFANVAFSDGSLLHGFTQRILKGQPLSAPRDVRRYFVTFEEAGQLCMLSCLLGANRDIFFPMLREGLQLVTFSAIAERFLQQRGYEPVVCDTEDEARARVGELKQQKKWPCYFFDSDTTGEKEIEEFFTDRESVDFSRFHTIGVVENTAASEREKLEGFRSGVEALLDRGSWEKTDLMRLFLDLLPDFAHLETGKSLDERM